MDLTLLWIVLSSMFASQLLGFVWYGPLFGKIWMREMGWTELSEEEIAEKQKGAVPGYIYSMGMAAFTSAAIWAVLFWDEIEINMYSKLDQVPEWQAGAIAGAAGWLLFYFPATSMSRFFEEKSWTLYSISAGYILVTSTLFGLYAGLFQQL